MHRYTWLASYQALCSAWTVYDKGSMCKSLHQFCKQLYSGCLHTQDTGVLSKYSNFVGMYEGREISDIKHTSLQPVRQHRIKTSSKNVFMLMLPA